MKVFVYVVGKSNNPDAIECMVPYKVNENTIFFGPCKKPLREHLYERYLKNSDDGEAEISDGIYVVGVNAYNPQKIRNIVWVGKIVKVLTFERAYNVLSSKEEFKEMMKEKWSPLHLKPLYENGTFIGYGLRSKMHEEEDEWILDIIKKKDDPNAKLEGKCLYLKDPSKRKNVFIRDCVFLCKNIFFAEGKGIDIDSDILSIFKKAQPGKSISKYAIFGLSSNGSANGLRGSYLTIDGELANALIQKITKKKAKIQVLFSRSKNIRYQGKCK